MTKEHLEAVLDIAGAKAGPDGYSEVAEGRLLTLYVAQGSGAALTVARVEAVSARGSLLHARTAKGDTFVLALQDVYAGAVEGEPKQQRKAGFV